MNLGFHALGFMALSEPPETRWAVAGSASAQLDWGVRIFAATHEYLSRETDAPPSQLFIGTVQKAFRFDRSIIGSRRVGEEITVGYGEVTLSNLERDYDELAVNTSALGQPIEILYGDWRRPLAEMRTVLRGYMTDMRIDRNAVTFRIRDAGHVLDVPAAPNVYLGTGGIEGTEDLKGKRKPRVFGWISEWPAPLLIPGELVYQLNDGEIHAVIACRVRGIEQTFIADYPTLEALIAAPLDDGEYGTCLALGLARIGVANDEEKGDATWDFAGDAAGGIFAETTADIVQRVLTTATVLTVADLVTGSFDDLNQAQPAPVGYGVRDGDEQTVATLAAALMGGIGGWCAPRRNGKFEVRRFEAPGNDVPAGNYSRLNLADLKLGVLPTDVSPPVWRVRVGYARIWKVGQTDLAGSLDDTYRAYLAQELRFASAENVRVRNDFPPGHELILDQTYFRDEADALAEAERQQALWGVPRNLYVLPLMDRNYTHELGQTVAITWDGFDLEAGKRARIAAITEDDKEGVELQAIG